MKLGPSGTMAEGSDNRRHGIIRMMMMLLAVMATAIAVARLATLSPSARAEGEYPVLPEPTGDQAYLTRFELSKNPNLPYDSDDALKGFGIIDGTNPWDPDDTPGNDSNAANFRCRTFDTVTYNLEYATQVHQDAEASGFDQGWLWLRVDLPNKGSECKPDLENLNWMDSVTWTENADGTQTLTGRYRLVHKESIDCSIPGGGTLVFPINVYNMASGSHLTPTFSAWIEGNDTDGTCDDHGFTEVRQITDGHVEISCTPSYNIQIRPTGDGYVNAFQQDWDFTTGNAQALNKDLATTYPITNGVVNGRLAGYGITVQLYNTNASKSLRGIELPRPDTDIVLEFDLTSQFRPIGTNTMYDTTTNYQPLVWSQGENYPAGSDDGRAYPLGVANYAVYAAPRSSIPTSVWQGKPVAQAKEEWPTWHNCCFQSGDWQATQTGTTYRAVIHGWEINPDFFPNADYGYGNYQIQYYDPSAVEVANIGCFSAGKLYVVQPFYSLEDGTYILEDTSLTGDTISSGDFFTRISLKSVSITPNASTDYEASQLNVITSGYDDFRDYQVYLTRPGTYDTRIAYAPYHTVPGGASRSYDYAYDIQNIYGGNGAYANGRDWAMPGHHAAIRWGCTYNAQGDTNIVTYAADCLLKFDPEAIDILRDADGNALWTSRNANGEVISGDVYSNNYYGYRCKYVYVAKPDGTTWADDDEMNVTTMKDLVVYSSLADLELDGKVCVGVIAQFRKLVGSIEHPNLTLTTCIGIEVKNDIDLIGNIYGINTETYEWTRNQYDWLCENYGNDGDMWFTQADSAFKAFVDESVTRSDTLRAIFNGTGGNTLARQEAWEALQGNDIIAWHYSPSYRKEALNANGQYVGNHTGSYQYGDSLQIIGGISHIATRVRQMQSDGITPMNNYNLGDDQRYVDWIVYPSIALDDSRPNTTGMTTYITIEDTIPKGLTYKELSTYWGGTYTQAERTGRQGTVEGGTMIPQLEEEPADPTEYRAYMVVTDNANGTQTMRIRINDIVVGDSIDPIIFTTLIGTPDNPRTDVTNNEEFKTTAIIRTPIDSRAIVIGNGNISEAGMKVTQLAAVALQKHAKTKINEKESQLEFTLITANNAALPIPGNMIIDRMPYDNDGRGSHIQNGYTLGYIRIDKAPLSATSLASMRIYVTTDPAYRSTSDTDICEAQFRDTVIRPLWTLCPVDLTTGEVDISAISGQPVEVAIMGDLEPGEVHRVLLGIVPNEPDVNDTFINKLATQGTATNAKEEYAKRSLSGTAWYDMNQSGTRDDGETLFANVPVSLWVLDHDTDEYVPVMVGSTQRTTVTDSQGNYLFDDLDAGTYEVRFGDTSQTRDLILTKQNAGSNDTIDSDTAAVTNANEVRQYAHITGIIIPKASQMDEPVYESKHNDSGYTNSIWVANNTLHDKGGHVIVFGYPDTESTVSSDGHDDNTKNRKPTNVVRGTPDEFWVVDMGSIYVEGQKVTVGINGTFSVTSDGKTVRGTVTEHEDGYVDIEITNFAEALIDVDVDLGFKPTIWVENTTDVHAQMGHGGTVMIDGYPESENEESAYGRNTNHGREPITTVSGHPYDDYAAEPTSVYVSSKGGTPFYATNGVGDYTFTDDNGETVRFTVSVSPLTGVLTVDVTEANSPIDVGMAFYVMRRMPVTGMLGLRRLLVLASSLATMSMTVLMCSRVSTLREREARHKG